MHGALAILVALIHRNRTGEGQYVDVSMTDAIVGLMMPVLLPALIGETISEQGENIATGEQQRPWYNVYKTKDAKYISLGSVEPWFYSNLCELIERPDLLPYEWDIMKWGQLSDEFRKIFKTKNRDEWVELLRKKDVCVAPVYTVDETFKDPQVLRVARSAVSEVRGQGPSAINGSFRQALCLLEALRLHGMSYAWTRPPPTRSSLATSSPSTSSSFQWRLSPSRQGDCDDLSTLYAAMLEAVGIPTAFITTPGHIFLAFSLGMEPQWMVTLVRRN
jgi:crotonobetainyl-CoA:carnitine CoA-transferase CaiB-like acyl-CoA transferase